VSQHEVIAALAAAAPLPCDAAGPVFVEPWQAQAFAMVVACHQRGLFTWPEWAAALSAEIKAHGGDDDGARYYEFWLHALEDLLVAKGAASSAHVDDLAAAWSRAAEATPHGAPITLANDPVGSGAAKA
jgi:nitrile hydratase accessory protein